MVCVAVEAVVEAEAAERLRLRCRVVVVSRSFGAAGAEGRVRSLWPRGRMRRRSVCAVSPVDWWKPREASARICRPSRVVHCVCR